MRELPYFECHITVALRDLDMDEYLTQKILLAAGWKFSKIDGDPRLGDGVKMYGTSWFPVDYGVKDTIRAMEDLAGTLRNANMKVLRSKVETVVYDKVWE